MRPELFTAKNVIVQGITGTHGAFHTKAMLAASTHIVAGTSTNKSGATIPGVPVYKTAANSRAAGIADDISVIFVPAPFAKSAMIEAIEADVPLIVCITEGVPIHDMLTVKQAANDRGVIILGPNCPGALLPGVNKLGIIPANMGKPGSVGIVSRSGTLTYEAMAGLSQAGIGQRYVIGIGGDRIKGIDFTDCLELFENDSQVDRIVLIGEIGGTSEHMAAAYLKTSVTKPVYAYVAGHQAPAGVQLGHAGAILGGEDESAGAKTKNLRDHGAITANSIAELIQSIAHSS